MTDQTAVCSLRTTLALRFVRHPFVWSLPPHEDVELTTPMLTIASHHQDLHLPNIAQLPPSTPNLMAMVKTLQLYKLKLLQNKNYNTLQNGLMALHHQKHKNKSRKNLRPMQYIQHMNLKIKHSSHEFIIVPTHYNMHKIFISHINKYKNRNFN